MDARESRSPNALQGSELPMLVAVCFAERQSLVSHYLQRKREIQMGTVLPCSARSADQELPRSAAYPHRVLETRSHVSARASSKALSGWLVPISICSLSLSLHHFVAQLSRTWPGNQGASINNNRSPDPMFFPTLSESVLLP